MSEDIHAQAFVSVARGCAFAGLATLTTMVGLSGDPAVALRFGGHAFLLTSFILIAMALRAPQKSYKRTEVWLLLDRQRRPPPAIAQQVIGAARRETLAQFARLHAALSLVFLIVSLPVRLVAGA
jgi:hypothetical protein